MVTAGARNSSVIRSPSVVTRVLYPPPHPPPRRTCKLSKGDKSYLHRAHARLAGYLTEGISSFVLVDALLIPRMLSQRTHLGGGKRCVRLMRQRKVVVATSLVIPPFDVT